MDQSPRTDQLPANLVPGIYMYPVLWRPKWATRDGMDGMGWDEVWDP